MQPRSEYPCDVGDEIPLDETTAFEITMGVKMLQKIAHERAVSAGWWHDLKSVPYQPKERNVGEMMMLMVTELSEGFEGFRKDLMDDKLPNRPMIEVEFADVMIRIMDFAGRYRLDVAGAIIEKMQFNAGRADHKIENRIKDGGKKY